MDSGGSTFQPADWCVREPVAGYVTGPSARERSPQPHLPRIAEPSDWIQALSYLLVPQMSMIQEQFADAARIVNEFPSDDVGAVLGFLLEHSTLPKFIVDSAREIRRHFGREARFTLHLMHDPDEGFEELFLVINTGRELGEAFDLLSKFDDWFIELPFTVRKDFCVTLR